MKHRVRAAALIVSEGRIRLVEHQDHKGKKWWIPPGGGLEDVDATIMDCAKREVLEETGLHVQIGDLRYIREFIDNSNDTRHLELFFAAELDGEQRIERTQPAPTLYDHMIVSVKWFSRDELRELVIFPEVLKEAYWDAPPIAGPVYLGVSIESDDRKS